MSQRKPVAFPLVLGFIVLLIIIAPYVFAQQAGGEGLVFNGFLFNPLDGNSYLAKMYQGWRGDWRFHLPFTAEPGKGAYLFIFYLALGHLARILNIPLLLTFHITRVLCAGLLIAEIWRFFGKIFTIQQYRRLAFALALLGSGMGWLLLPVGAFTSDFWVAETYPFLSMFANPHFSLGLALVLWLIKPQVKRTTNRFLAEIVVALILGVSNPFGVVIALMILAALSLWNSITSPLANPFLSIWNSIDRRFFSVFLGGAPFLLYDFWVTKTDPVLAGWDAQNLTLSPPVWDVLISLSPVLILALVPLLETFYLPAARLQFQKNLGLRQLLIWLVFGLGLLYIPFNLQRRFMMGLFIPLVGLSVWSFGGFGIQHTKRYRLAVVMLFVLMVPTNLIVILAGMGAAATQNLQMYLFVDEVQAFDWIEANTAAEALILASPETGLYIPAYTGRRVIYGHPYETINAESEQKAVQDFYSAEFPDSLGLDFLSQRDVDYVFFGPREQSLGEMPQVDGLTLVQQFGDVALYQFGQ